MRAHWGTRLGFILAAAGSAIGLGNIWKFPYITGENGGGLFVLIYLGCVAVVGLPIMIAEILIGRAAQSSPVSAYKRLSGEDSPWQALGWLGVVCAFVILSYYSVVAGWSLNYIILSLVDTTHGKTPDQIGGIFDTLYKSGSANLLWHFVFLSLTVGIVYGGVQRGIEKACRVLMPMLFVMVGALVVYCLIETPSGFAKAFGFILEPDREKLTPRGVLEALGHSFFTLSLGMGAMLTYGSYMSKEDDITRSSLWIVGLDTLISMLACFMIFPFVLGHGQVPAQGPGLVFKTLPIIFSTLPAGLLVSLVFFVLLALAALTSAISLLEVSTSYFIDEHEWERPKAVLVTGVITLVLGVPSALAGGGGMLPEWEAMFGMNFFDTFDYLASNWLLTFGGFATAIYAGWFLPDRLRREEFASGSRFGKLYPVWLWTLRVSPVAILVVLLYKVGLLKV